MINWIKNLFTGTTVPETPFQDFSDIGIAQRPSAPYKVPAPVVVEEAKVIEPVITEVKKATAKKATAKKATAKKPAAKKTKK